MFEPTDEGCTKREEIACVRLEIENFGSTSPAWGGFQPIINNGMKADNHNGMKAENHNGTKADNHNGTKAENHNGTKADNPNSMNALNFDTHRSEESNWSWSWQLHYYTRCLPDGLHDLIHFCHLLLCCLQLSTQVRSSPLFLPARPTVFQSHISVLQI
jgi:hypothetical protein